MLRSGFLKRALCGLLLAGLFPAAPPLLAEEPRVVSPTVPYVPTPQNVVDRMLTMGRVGAQDYLIDLGSGDGRIVITAARRFGTRGFGVDINPVRIGEAVENARKAGVTDKVTFIQRDLFETDLSQATVITMYLLPRVNIALRPKLLDLKPGTRLVSHDFDMGDWKPDEAARIPAPDKYGGSGGESDIYLWVVPAKAGGGWRVTLPVSGKPQAYEINLEQKYQFIAGSARLGERATRIENARLRGDEISFTFTLDVNGAPMRHEFSGRVTDGRMSGDVRLSGSRVAARVEWNAERAVAPRAP
jgi:hypothetical protein